MLTSTNFNFMGAILPRWEGDPSIHLRARNLREEHVDADWWNPRNTVLDRLREDAVQVPDFLREDLEWADVVYVEWGEALAARLSGARFSAKLVVRLHRYEAFTSTPTLTDWNGVHDLVIITPYIREVLRRTIPDIEERTSIRLVPNVVELARFNAPKLPAASRNLALVQFYSMVKDPLWALDVLRLLHREDPSWKLLLIGSASRAAEEDEATRRYLDELDRRIHAFGDSVQHLGHRSDLPEVMRSVGVIMSSSLVEGAPVSLQEGIASGALPVVRDWPIVKPLDAAAQLYPEPWIAETPEQAAERILAWAPPAGEIADDKDAREWIVEHFDATVTSAELNDVVFHSTSHRSDTRH